MINHLNLAKKLKPGSYDDAIDEYHKEVDFYCSNLEKTKDYIYGLNNFLFTYFLLVYNKDLEELAIHNRIHIKACTTRSELVALGLEILRKYTKKFSTSLHDNEHELIEQALKYINANFQNKITLTSLANKLHISKNYLCHLFKTKTGYKFCEYINLQRINLAKKLIAQNKKSLEYIAFECGFSSQSHFSTTFKKYVGLTPKEFRPNN